VTQSFAYVAAPGLEAIRIYRIDDGGALVSVEVVQAGEGARFVAVHPSNRFAYAANGGDNNVSIFALDPATGRLSGRVDVAAGNGAQQIRIHPSGNFAYVTNRDDGTVSVYSIHADTGMLSPSGAAVAVGAGPEAIVIDPTGRFAFVQVAQGVESYSIAASGAMAPINAVAMGVAVNDIALSPSGSVLYAAAADGSVSKLSVDGAGALSAVATFTTGGAGEQTIFIEPNGRVAYVTSLADNSVAAFGIEPLTGDLILPAAGTVSLGADPGSVAMGPTGEFLYATNEGADTISVYSVNQASGALTAVGTPVAADFAPVGITIVRFPR
jgi:6-phosphogluconolactonase (cycloisomerase 2 family)